MSRPKTLFSFDFIAICLLIFLTYCNITVFYDLYLYLQQIGIPKDWRGFLIGSSSLSTIVFFLFASPYLTTRNAARWAGFGAVLLLGSGTAYLYVHDVVGLLTVRLANGVGVYLLSAACMTMMVSRIPPERSGQAFSLYSVALLLPYSIVPAVCDVLTPHLASAAVGYRDMSLLLLPGLVLVFIISRRQKENGEQAKAAARISLGDMYRNAASAPIALVLALNTIYIVTFASLFFMAKGLFQSRGYNDVGSYFSIQMGCMILIRAFGNHLFDKVRKVQLIRFSFILCAVSFLLAAGSDGLWGLYASSLAMGIGMGVGSPALYALMFAISPPRFKAINSNLMMLSLQIGNFLGPLLGAWTMHVVGYGGFLLADAGASLLGVAVCSLLTSRFVDHGGLAARA
jgi:MFS family permease